MREQAGNLQSTEAPLSDDRFQRETSTDDCLEGCRTGNEAVSAPQWHRQVALWRVVGVIARCWQCVSESPTFSRDLEECSHRLVPATLHWHRSQNITRHFSPEDHEVRRWYPRGNSHLHRVVG